MTYESRGPLDLDAAGEGEGEPVRQDSDQPPDATPATSPSASVPKPAAGPTGRRRRLVITPTGGIVLVMVVAAAAYLLWSSLSPQTGKGGETPATAPPTTSTRSGRPGLAAASATDPLNVGGRQLT